MNTGVLAAIGAFTLWGFLPLYLKLLDHASAVEIMAHRLQPPKDAQSSSGKRFSSLTGTTR